MLRPSQAQRKSHPLFPWILTQILADTAFDIGTFVGHLRVEVDVGNSEFLGVHPRDQVLDIAAMTVAVAQHHDALRTAVSIEDEGIGGAPYPVKSE